MNKSIFKKSKLLHLFSESLIYLPTPININYIWNFGSLLGLCLIIQILSGLFLSIHYCPNINLAFYRVIHIIKDINYGWLIRLIHINGASLFFIFIYIHIGRGIYYSSYILFKTWYVGIIIFLLTIITAFLGYVLPWGQISFWGATVITNLLSAIPYFGTSIVEWIWGGFSVNNPTLNRFYTLHFILPFIILILVVIHLIFLHNTGSRNPLGLNRNYYKIIIYFYFILKDLITFILLFLFFLIFILQYPQFLNDPDNFILANPINTPPHIKPEWYFLFAYAILRAIPNKLGGVLRLFISILILSILSFKNSKNKSIKFNPIIQSIFWFFCNSFFILTWLGIKDISYPYIQISQIYTISYFIFFITHNYIWKLWDNFIYK